ncbi:hypothetical protein B7494_g3249 [Chlorociboria aeruginascens]|nr:hypothetical protein B7494_g3249 [Chlorociboria aeruginascens]
MSFFSDLFSFLFALLNPTSTPLPQDIDSISTSFLDHDSPISRFWGQTFLKENIPFIDIPDLNIQSVYYYRWSSIQRHLRYTTAGSGYILTEFCQPVGYAQAFNTIDAAAGHQIDEARWLRSNFYTDDYIQIYTRGPGNSTQYTHWILDALFRRSQVNGDSQFAADQLSDMVRLFEEWAYTFDPTVGLYYFTPNFDAQEFSLPGFVVAPPSDPSSNHQLTLDGPNTYRPSHNAYMVANAFAISTIATQAGNADIASQYSQVSNDIAAAMYTHLWDPLQQFFVDVIRDNNPNLTRLSGREEVGLYPFCFGIGLDPSYTNPAAQSLFDTQGFMTTYAPTTLEVRNHTYSEILGCDIPDSSLTAEQYVQYLSIYASTQQKDGQPYVAESHSPVENAWTADSTNHSEHYDHSTNNDDVITGLLGSGLTVFADGTQIYQGTSPSATIGLPATYSIPEATPINIAANPIGINAPDSYPLASATYTYSTDDPYKAIDGYLFYDAVPDNRWTNYQSPSPNDTLIVTFPRLRKASSVTLALYYDISRNGSVDLPSRIEIYGSSGLISTISSGFLANDKNTFSFPEVETDVIAVNLFNNGNFYVGICELEVWTDPVTGPEYFAVDTFLTDAKVVNDVTSTATSNGAVVGGLSAESLVAFSGVQSDDVGTKVLGLCYSNNGTDTVSIDVRINQVRQGSLSLGPTGGSYESVTLNVELSRGSNFVTLVGGSNGILLETLNIS